MSAEGAASVAAEHVALPEIDFSDSDAPRPAAPGRLAERLMLAAALLAAASWIAAAVWASLPVLRQGATPMALIQTVAVIATPLALIALLWLIVQRSGIAEANRFARSARMMRAEAGHLDELIAVLAHRLDANRAELRDQADRLLAQGNAAAERLAAISNGIATETASIDSHAQRLLQAATAARADMSVLLATVPKAVGQVRDISSRLQTSSDNARQSAALLTKECAELEAKGRTASEAASAAAVSLGERLDAVRDAGSAASDRIEATLAGARETVEHAGETMTGQAEAMRAVIAATHAEIVHVGGGAVEAMAERIDAIEASIARIADSLAAQREAGLGVIATIDKGIDGVEARFSQLDETGASRTARLSQTIEQLRERAESLGEVLVEGSDRADQLRTRADDLLVSLEANAREIDETLPQALRRLEDSIAAARTALAPVAADIDALVAPAEQLCEASRSVATIVSQQRDRITAMEHDVATQLRDGTAHAEQIVALIGEAERGSTTFAETAAPRLLEALLRVRDTAMQASDKARTALSGVIPDAAQALADASTTALGDALDATLQSRLVELRSASEEALAAAQGASDRLLRQMLTIAETTAQVEARLAEAKAEREAQDEEAFARRVSLLLESLNSAAIDVTKLLSNEVTDVAWASYLRGDRGVFTRRAVRLLDATQARAVARHYDEDAEFRNQVNRYIHDFEAMLRTVLAAREGSAIGVTLLSSDMGKLYVALAQGIERLRT